MQQRSTCQRVLLRDGSWLTVDVHGDPSAPTLVVVPGVMSDARAWRRVAKLVRAWPTIAVVNRRGRYPSAPLPPQYSLNSEMDDLAQVLASISDPRALFGWSYGGLAALALTERLPFPHVIAYEPVMRPFGAHALEALQAANGAEDFDRVVEIVCIEISGLGSAAVEQLRSDTTSWGILTQLARPVFAETVALNETPIWETFADRAEHVDLIIGGRNQELAPYGTIFESVSALTPGARLHTLAERGHMAHLEAPAQLAVMMDSLNREHSARV